MKRIDLVGKRFGRIIVLSFCQSMKNKLTWKCKCDCGKKIILGGKVLKNGHTKSCGCLQKELMKKMFRTHGMAKTRIHTIWCAMIRRCQNKNATNFKYYGGRGIEVCSSWHDSTIFIAWAQTHGYRDDLTIDRINNDGNYEPENCRWITFSENIGKRNKAQGGENAGREQANDPTT